MLKMNASSLMSVIAQLYLRLNVFKSEPTIGSRLEPIESFYSARCIWQSFLETNDTSEWDFAYNGPLLCKCVITFLVLSTMVCLPNKSQPLWSMVFQLKGERFKLEDKNSIKHSRLNGNILTNRRYSKYILTRLQPLFYHLFTTKWSWNGVRVLMLSMNSKLWAEARAVLFSDLKVLLSALKRVFKIQNTAKSRHVWKKINDRRSTGWGTMSSLTHLHPWFSFFPAPMHVNSFMRFQEIVYWWFRWGISVIA